VDWKKDQELLNHQQNGAAEEPGTTAFDSSFSDSAEES